MINLAQPMLGSKVVFKTDDFFASAHRIINSDPPIFREEFLINMVNGWMDGRLEENEKKVLTI